MLRPLALALLTLLTACQPDLPGVPVADDDPAFALARDLDRGAWDAAWARLATVPHAATRTEERLDAQGAVLGRRTLRAEPGQPPVVTDSAGAFGDAAGAFRADSLGRYLLPAEPLYLSPRGRERYRFVLEEDTVLHARPARVLTVRLRDGHESDDGIVGARLFVDRATDALVGADVRRDGGAWLLGERSRLAAWLRPTPEGWLPDRSDFDVALDVPLAEPSRFRARAAYGYPGR